MNKPFPSFLKPLFQSEAKCEAIDTRIIFYSLKINLVFARKVLHLPVASFWKHKFWELGDGLLKFLKAMLYDTICKGDFQHITAM